MEVQPTHLRSVADAHVVLGAIPFEFFSPAEAMPKACFAADKVLPIDPNLGEARAARAFISWLYACDPKAAETAFGRAIALNPSYSTAHQWYAVFLAHQGDNAGALAETDLARKIDPFSLQINTAAVQVLYCKCAYDQAIECAIETLDLDSTFTTALMLSVAYLRKASFAGGLRATEKAAGFSGQSAAALVCVVGCHAASGQTGEALATVERLKALSQERHV